MAAKALQAGDKRKAVSNGKPKMDGKSKKPRLDKPKSSRKSDQRQEDDSIEESDSDEEGGAKLSLEPANKVTNSSSVKKDDSKGSTGFDRAGLTSRESHAKQNQLAQERKGIKPLAYDVQRTKKIWERLRRKSHVPKDERKQLVEELFGIILGRCKEFVLKHDAVRAVQTAIKYASPEQRKQIARELAGSYAQLAESRYAKFLIGKLLVQQDDEIRDMVISDFYGRIRKLINHVEASWIVDDIYRTVATKEQKDTMLREWYGPEFSIREMMNDRQLDANLAGIIAKEPNKRGPLMKSLFDMINTLVQKKMTGFTMLHDAMLQYFNQTSPGTEEFTEFFELVKGDESGDLLKNMAFTKSGARLTSMLFAHGTTKDRKQLLKMYKNAMTLMSGDTFAHVVILTAYDVIDDTKLVIKTVIPELVGDKADDAAQNILASVNNANARTTILYPFIGLSRSFFPPSHGFDLEVLEKAHKIRKSTCKKDNDLRHQELAAALSPHLLSAIAAIPRDLVSTAFGCQFVTEVLLSGVGDKTQALKAIAESAAGDTKSAPTADDLKSKEHVSQTPFGGRMLKSLIQGGRYDKAAGKVVQVEPPLRFADVLYPIIESHIMTWATGPSSFVVLALVEAEDFSQIHALKKTLRKNKTLLEKASTEMTEEQKTAREQLLSAEATGSKGKKKNGADAVVGNMGSRLLLEKL